MPDAPKRMSYRETVRTLAIAQKSSAGAQAYSRFVNRPLGRLLAAAAYQTPLTPNQVTMLSAAASAAGIAVIVLLGPTWPGALAAAFLLVLGYALDSADGQLARLRQVSSMAGEWLDHVVDCVKISALHLGVLVSLWWHTDHTAALALPLLFTIAANLYFFAFILGDLLRRSTGVAKRKGGSTSILRSLVVLPVDYGFLCVIFLLFGLPTVFLAAYAVLLAGHLGYLALGLPRWFGDMRRLDRT